MYKLNSWASKSPKNQN